MRLSLGLNISNGGLSLGAPILADLIPGTLFEIDAADPRCYPGSGESLYDINANAAYTFTKAGTGSFSYTNKRVILGGDCRFQLASNPTPVANFHKTTGGQNHWIGILYKFIQNDSFQSFIGTKANSTAIGVQIASGSNENISYNQADGTTNSSNSSPPSSMVNDTVYFVLYARNNTTNKTTRWINSSTGLESEHVFQTTTGSSTNLAFGASTVGASSMPANSEIMWVGAGTTYLNDSQVSSIISMLKGRGYQIG